MLNVGTYRENRKMRVLKEFIIRCTLLSCVVDAISLSIQILIV